MSATGRIEGAATRLARAGLAGLAMAGLAACGGGGGGGAAPQPAAITADNAELISAEVLAVIGLASGVGPSGAGGVIGSDAGGTGAEALRLGAAGRRTILQAGALEAFGPEELDCIVGGTVVIGGDIANFDTLTAGDVINATFTDCDDGFGEVLNGALRLDVVVGANPTDDFENGLFAAAFNATFTAFRIDADDGSFTTDGTARIDLDTTQSPEEAILSGTSLRFTQGSDRYTLTDFAVALLVNALGNPATTQVAGTGTLASNDFTGTVDFVTEVDLVAAGDDDPDEGVVEVFGAAGSQIRITVQDSVNLQLQVDVDGNDQTDVTIATTWEVLRSIAGAGTVGSSVLQEFNPVGGRGPG